MKKKKKSYYIVFILLFLYLLFMFYFFVIPSSHKSSRKMYIMVDNTAKWKFEGKKWEDIKSTESNLYDWQEFSIYKRGNYLGKYYLLYNDQFLWYDKNRHPIQKNGSTMLAVRSNQDFKVAEYSTTTISLEDMSYVDEILQQYNISTREIIFQEAFSYDLDSDGNQEKIFTVSNLFEPNYAPDKIFSFIFVVKNDRITVVSSMVDTLDKKNEHCRSYVHSLVDTNQDGNYEFITGCGYYNSTKNCVEMFEYQKNQYKKIKSCQE